MCSRLLTLILVLMVFVVGETWPARMGASAAAPRTTSASPSFADSFDNYLRDDSIVGASYVVVERGRIIEWHTTGMADRETGQAVDRNTIFH